MSEKLVLNEEAIKELGFVDTAIYTVEYDLHSKLKIPKDADPATKEAMKKQNILAVKFRNRLFHTLRFNCCATTHLESSWIIEEQYLATTTKEIETLKTDMKAHGFKDVDKRIRIIPILTTSEGLEHYDEQKAKYLISFLLEHVRYCEKAKEEDKMSGDKLWRCKKTLEIVNILKKEVKETVLFNELEGTLAILDSLINEVTPIAERKKD